MVEFDVKKSTKSHQCYKYLALKSKKHFKKCFLRCLKTTAQKSYFGMVDVGKVCLEGLDKHRLSLKAPNRVHF